MNRRTFLAATLFGLVAHWLKQPILLGYLIAGVLIQDVDDWTVAYRSVRAVVIIAVPASAIYALMNAEAGAFSFRQAV